MTTIEVLRTARALAKHGHSASACSFGDWPDAVDAWRRANGWRAWFPLPVTRGMLVRSIDRAIRLLEVQQQLEREQRTDAKEENLKGHN